MARTGHLDIEQLARELKVLLDVGLRPPKVRGRLADLPLLSNLAQDGGRLDDAWLTAAAICQLVTEAVAELGTGPYGQAVSDLFGTVAATRGLPKHRRRCAASDDLETELPTFVRHWERDILLDVAVTIGRRVQIDGVAVSPGSHLGGLPPTDETSKDA